MCPANRSPLVVSSVSTAVITAVASAGWYVRKLPHLPAQIASDLVHSGYIRIPGGRVGPNVRYAALTDIADVDEDGVHLRVAAPDLPVER
jgi:hypothetical protein